MQAGELQAAIAAALATASALGLAAAEAVVLQDANRVALRLSPCDILARVAVVAGRPQAELEIEIARQLTEAGSPVGTLDARVEPRVYERDGFIVTFWTYYEPSEPLAVEPSEYADALARLHAGMRTVDVPVPHFSARITEAQRIVGDRGNSPALADVDRELLVSTLRTLRESAAKRGATEQLLHGEPHPGNLLRTKDGLLFIDFETCCRGPVEFDVAGTRPDIGKHYLGLDKQVLAECRVLTLALVAAWRSDSRDQYPEGRKMQSELLARIRAMVEGYGLDVG